MPRTPLAVLHCFTPKTKCSISHSETLPRSPAIYVPPPIFIMLPTFLTVRPYLLVINVQYIVHDLEYLSILCIMLLFANSFYSGDKNYIFIEEMLTRQLLVLDSIHADGNEELRLSRRSIVKQVQGLLSTLEMKAKT